MLMRPIVIGLSPNTQKQDYKVALKVLLRPRSWQKGGAVAQVEEWFKNYFRVSYAVTFNAGRSALLAALTSLELPNGSEVLLQAFTCVAVPNSILWSGLQPVYVDIDRTLNFDVADAEEKITPKTRALVVQHTFGIPADMERIVSFCKQHGLVLIEDCAHALAATYKGKPVGTFGDVAIFSFGRDKIVSCVLGGIAITNNKQLGKKLADFREHLPIPSKAWTAQQLLHPLISTVVLAFYNILGIGKIILFLAQKARLLSFPVYASEKKGSRPAVFPQNYPNALAQLLLVQLARLDKDLLRRKEIARIYFKKLKSGPFILPKNTLGATYLRFNLLTQKADEYRYQAKKKGIILGNWYRHVVDPSDVKLETINYIEGSCPNAEKAAARSLNLPTYPALTNTQIDDICRLIIEKQI